MAKQQEIFEAFRDEVVSLIDSQVNSVSDSVAPDNAVLPVAVISIITDSDEYLLGDDVINDIFIQVSIFGKKSSGVSTIRDINDNLVDGMNRKELSNGMAVRVINKGLTIMESINDPNVNVMSEYRVR